MKICRTLDAAVPSPFLYLQSTYGGTSVPVNTYRDALSLSWLEHGPAFSWNARLSIPPPIRRTRGGDARTPCPFHPSESQFWLTGLRVNRDKPKQPIGPGLGCRGVLCQDRIKLNFLCCCEADLGPCSIAQHAEYRKAMHMHVHTCLRPPH